ncbi:serine O-acetyltransferase EpsC [Desulfovibrio litoralis]|uniref:serine O-acetyltransferase n=1 Tax=Desulfovibrio litoralis DSM 11393 TaxID=1121455 RepID=A0A1M7RVD7_9BACT|nr:serine O-acetyltransferase EpsC [Desulfovibrio litoralis]SHN49972.1 serine O-acetyltransferase [Desulfovibrio litoralis DSM 11393]
MKKEKSDLKIPVLDNIVDALCQPSSYEPVLYRAKSHLPMLSGVELQKIVSLLRQALFPGYFGETTLRLESMRYQLAANLDTISRLLSEQIARALCFDCDNRGVEQLSVKSIESRASELALAFLSTLPKIRHLLVSDVVAAYEGDPAAKTPAETILCYPSISVMINHRIAHELYSLNIPFIPRIISESAHSLTGIDIHPGANIGEEFFIDHGTGVVIGETSIIGQRCRLYQGVTLGALSFPKEEDGSLTKGIARHPILEDRVTVYAGATILGRVTIGADATIGGNTWITQNVPAGTKILQTKYVND